MIDLTTLEHLIPMKTLAILIVVLYIIGVVLKHTPKVKDWIIPWVLLVLGILGSIGLQMGEATYLLAGLQGVICAFIAISINQFYVQTVYKRPLAKAKKVADTTEEPKVEDSKSPAPEVSDQKEETAEKSEEK